MFIVFRLTTNTPFRFLVRFFFSYPNCGHHQHRSKRGCSGGNPCEQCEKRGKSCTYAQRRMSGPRGRPSGHSNRVRSRARARRQRRAEALKAQQDAMVTAGEGGAPSSLTYEHQQGQQDVSGGNESTFGSGGGGGMVDGGAVGIVTAVESFSSRLAGFEGCVPDGGIPVGFGNNSGGVGGGGRGRSSGRSNRSVGPSGDVRALVGSNDWESSYSKTDSEGVPSDGDGGWDSEVDIPLDSSRSVVRQPQPAAAVAATTATAVAPSRASVAPNGNKPFGFRGTSITRQLSDRDVRAPRRPGLSSPPFSAAKRQSVSISSAHVNPDDSDFEADKAERIMEDDSGEADNSKNAATLCTFPKPHMFLDIPKHQHRQVPLSRTITDSPRSSSYSLSPPGSFVLSPTAVTSTTAATTFATAPFAAAPFAASSSRSAAATAAAVATPRRGEILSVPEPNPRLLLSADLPTVLPSRKDSNAGSNCGGGGGGGGSNNSSRRVIINTGNDTDISSSDRNVRHDDMQGKKRQQRLLQQQQQKQQDCAFVGGGGFGKEILPYSSSSSSASSSKSISPVPMSSSATVSTPSLIPYDEFESGAAPSQSQKVATLVAWGSHSSFDEQAPVAGLGFNTADSGDQDNAISSSLLNSSNKRKLDEDAAATAVVSSAPTVVSATVGQMNQRNGCGDGRRPQQLQRQNAQNELAGGPANATRTSMAQLVHEFPDWSKASAPATVAPTSVQGCGSNSGSNTVAHGYDYSRSKHTAIATSTSTAAASLTGLDVGSAFPIWTDEPEPRGRVIVQAFPSAAGISAPATTAASSVTCFPSHRLHSTGPMKASSDLSWMAATNSHPTAPRMSSEGAPMTSSPTVAATTPRRTVEDRSQFNRSASPATSLSGTVLAGTDLWKEFVDLECANMASRATPITREDSLIRALEVVGTEMTLTPPPCESHPFAGLW